MSLVGQLARTDSFGKPLNPVPSSSKGRYQPLATDDTSLQPISGGKKAALAKADKTM